MITNALTVAQKLLVARRKEVLAVGLMVLYTLGMIHPANAQEVTYIIFDPPGSTSSHPASINAKGAITGSYNDANFVLHGFLRAPDGSFTTFDAPGATSTFPQSINRVGAIAGSYDDSNFVLHGFLRSPHEQHHNSRVLALPPRHLQHFRSSGLGGHLPRQHQRGGSDHGSLQ